MSRRLVLSATASAALVLVVVLAGCGSGGGNGNGNGMMGGQGGMMNGGGTTMPARAPTGPPASATTAATTPASGGGRALFLASGCGGCHTLAAAGSTGSAGPDLDQARPSYQLVIQQVTHGGGGMPAFAGSLTGLQIRLLARYVADSTH